MYISLRKHKVEEGFKVNSYNEAYFDKAGVYIITKNFKKSYGTSFFSGQVGDLFDVSSPLHLQDGFSDGYKGNTFKKWNKQTKSWDQYNPDLANKNPKDAQEFMQDIEKNFKFVASKASSTKVQKLIFDGEDKLTFENPKDAIAFLSTLDKKIKINIELIK